MAAPGKTFKSKSVTADWSTYSASFNNHQQLSLCPCLHVFPGAERPLHPYQGLRSSWKKGSTVFHCTPLKCISVQVDWNPQTFNAGSENFLKIPDGRQCTIFDWGFLGEGNRSKNNLLGRGNAVYSKGVRWCWNMGYVQILSVWVFHRKVSTVLL